MSDFESLIRTMMENGASPEEITKRAGDIVGAIKQEKEEKEKKATAEKSRADLLAELHNTFDQAYRTKKCEIEDVAALVTVVCARSHPEWTEENIRDFFQCVQTSIQYTSLMIGKNPDQILLDLMDTIFKSPKNTKKKNSSKVTVEPTGKVNPIVKPYISKKDFIEDIVPEKVIRKFIEGIDII